MKTSRKKRTWIMVALLTLAASAVTTASTIKIKKDIAPVETVEEHIELEDWMGDPNYLANQELEDEVVVEEWMVDPEYLDGVIEMEDELELEDWMGDANYIS